MPAPFADIVAAELAAHDITLCLGCPSGDNHARGTAYPDSRTIHYSAKCATRGTLRGFLHEVGHVVLRHGGKSNLKRWEQEEQAEQYATDSLRQYGIPVPRKDAARGRAYVARMKRWGRNISAGLLARGR